MLKTHVKRLWLLLLLGLGVVLNAQEEAEKVLVESLTPESEVAYDSTTGLVIGTHGVVVRYGPTVLVADSVQVQQETGQADAQGRVSVQRGDFLWRGEQAHYNLKTQEMTAQDFRAGSPPFFIGGQSWGSKPGEGTNRVYTATNSFVTTDDLAKPGYRVRAKSLTIIPGKTIEARNATLLLGDVPVMYFPYFHHKLDGRPNDFTFTPGYRSQYGAFLRSAYNWSMDDYLRGALDLDLYQKRGVGVGPIVNYDAGQFGQGTLAGYYIHDLHPGNDPFGEPIRTDRQRISFSHRATLRTNLTATVVVQEQSDPWVVRDFFESQYRANPQPKSFVELDQHWSNFSLDFLAQPQVNDFFQTVERLPDVKLSGMRQQLGSSPFYYESDSSFGYLRYQPGEGSTTNYTYSALRADTFHQILLPETFFGWLNVTPRIGGRFTHYGETDVESGPNLSEKDRGVFNTGAEVSFKASQLWTGAKSKFWDANGIRHIIQPSLNYVFVPSPSVAPRQLPQFDTEIPSLHLLPIDFPDYNAIDDIDSQNVIRLGLSNKIQTKRKGAVDNIVNWQLFTDWRLDKKSGQTTFSDLFSELDFKPRSWITFSSETRVGIEDSVLRYSSHGLTLTPNDVWSISLGHIYVRDDPIFGTNSASSLLRSSIYYRLNENWGWRMTHHYDFHNKIMQEQYYTLYRDLRNWTSALTFRVRDLGNGPTDFTVAVTFSLKAFPRYRLGRDRDEHSVLLGGENWDNQNSPL